jgi:hypothetical protein
MNITIGSLHLVAETLGVQIVELFTGLEEEAELPSKRAARRSSPTNASTPRGRKR